MGNGKRDSLQGHAAGPPERRVARRAACVHAVLFAAACMVSLPAVTEQLTGLVIGRQVMESDVVYVPFEFVPGQEWNAAAVKWDFHYDPDYHVHDVLAGSAAQAAGKQVVYNEIAPGKIRIMVFGMNLDRLEAGPLADVYLIPSNPADEQRILETCRAENMLISDPYGAPVEAPQTEPQERETGRTDDTRDSVTSEVGGTDVSQTKSEDDSTSLTMNTVLDTMLNFGGDRAAIEFPYTVPHRPEDTRNQQLSSARAADSGTQDQARVANAGSGGNKRRFVASVFRPGSTGGAETAYRRGRARGVSPDGRVRRPVACGDALSGENSAIVNGQPRADLQNPRPHRSAEIAGPGARASTSTAAELASINDACFVGTTRGNAKASPGSTEEIRRGHSILLLFVGLGAVGFALLAANRAVSRL